MIKFLEFNIQLFAHKKGHLLIKKVNHLQVMEEILLVED